MQSHLPASVKILFVSDAHLGGFTPQKNKRVESELINLIQYAKKEQFQIAVLGDLFDYWMEYPNYVPPVGERLLQCFSEFNKEKTSLYITGNHDNWIRDHFSKQGFDIEPDYRLLTIGKKKVLLLHGDAIGEDPENLKRPLLHRILRNKMFIKGYQKILPAEAGVDLMKAYSRFTNFTTARQHNPVPLDEWSKKMLNNNDIDVIICGHDHVPRVHSYTFGNYLNTGAFYHHKTLVTYTNSRFKLVCWNNKEQKLTPFSPIEMEK